MSNTLTLTAVEIPAPPPPAAAADGASRKVAVALGSVLSPAAARSVTVTASAASAFGPSSTSSTKASNMANIVGAISCAFGDDDLGVSASQVLVVWSLGGGDFGGLYGPILSTLLMVVAMHILCAVMRWALPFHRRVRICGSLATTMLSGYLLPTTASMATTVLLHDTSTGARFAFGLIGLLLVLAVSFAPAALICLRRPLLAVVPEAVSESKSVETAEAAAPPPVKPPAMVRPPLESTLFSYVAYFDGARTAESLPALLGVFEDLLVSIVMSVIGAAKLEGISCTAVSTALTVVSLIHVAYLFVVRPLRSRLETLFANAIGVLQLITSMAVMGVTQGVAAFTDVVGYLTLTLSLSFALQTSVVLSWMGYMHWRRRQRTSQQRMYATDAMQSLLALPQLAAADEASSAAAGNGLPPHVSATESQPTDAIAEMTPVATPPGAVYNPLSRLP